jgi:hypothetical protein
LRGAKLQLTKLQGADLRFAKLQGADLRAAKLRVTPELAVDIVFWGAHGHRIFQGGSKSDGYQTGPVHGGGCVLMSGVCHEEDGELCAEVGDGVKG